MRRPTLTSSRGLFRLSASESTTVPSYEGGAGSAGRASSAGNATIVGRGDAGSGKRRWFSAVLASQKGRWKPDTPSLLYFVFSSAQAASFLVNVHGGNAEDDDRNKVAVADEAATAGAGAAEAGIAGAGAERRAAATAAARAEALLELLEHTHTHARTDAHGHARTRTRKHAHGHARTH